MKEYNRREFLGSAVGLALAGCRKYGELEKRVVKSSGIVSVEGAELRYVMEGKGTPLVAIGSSYYLPRAFSQQLRQHFKLICIDTRWYALTNTLEDISKITMDTLVDDIEQVRKTLGFDKIAVLGHSAYGLWALEYARRHPEHATHVIMHGTPNYCNPNTQKVRKEYWEYHASNERKEIYKRKREEFEAMLSSLSPSEAVIMNNVKNGPKFWYDPTYDCSWLWEGVTLKVDILDHYFDVIIPDYDFTKGDQITTPVFLALGKYDYICPYHLWDGYKDKFTNLSYNLFEKSGHWPMLEEHALFDKKLIAWIKGQ